MRSKTNKTAHFFIVDVITSQIEMLTMSGAVVIVSVF